MYPEEITAPMRQELTSKGFSELITAEDDVDVEFPYMILQTVRIQ